MTEGPEWFAPKRYGYGAGRPISWQGWAMLAGFLALLLGAVFLFREKPAVLLATTLPVVLLFTLIVARTTKGGWRWRWGKDD